MMIRQQDQTISTIAGTLNTLQEQAGLMGREIGEHNEYVFPSSSSPSLLFSLSTRNICVNIIQSFRMLDDLERNVEVTDSKLSNAMTKMKKFIRQTEGKNFVRFFNSTFVIRFPDGHFVL